MNGIIININPVALRLGLFEVRWYSIAVIVAVIAAALISVREGKRKGISSDSLMSLLPWVLIGGVVGARLFHVIDRWDYYVVNPAQIFGFQQGGLAIWGALVGGGIAAIIYARMRHIPLGRLADVLVPGLLIAQIIGRFGCIVNGDAYGGVTGLPWGFIYIHPDAMIPSNLVGVPTHPYPVYEMLWNGLSLLILLRLRRSFSKDGLLILSYLAFYSVGRFILTFVRQENAILWGFQQAQLLAIALAIVSAGALIYLVRKSRRQVAPESA